METRIAVCITTTPNRKDVLDNTIKQWSKVLPINARFFIHNDEGYKGVCYSKNKCLQWSEFADYVFCFDDDIWPTVPNWYEYYINSNLEHAAYTFNRKVLKEHKKFVEYVDPNGCMLFFTRKCIDTCGGWDTNFKGYGYEHSELSSRIHNLGLTPARFLDVKRPANIFDMANCESSFSYEVRASTIPINEKLYKEKFYSKEFKPFK